MKKDLENRAKEILIEYYLASHQPEEAIECGAKPSGKLITSLIKKANEGMDDTSRLLKLAYDNCLTLSKKKSDDTIIKVFFLPYLEVFRHYPEFLLDIKLWDALSHNEKIYIINSINTRIKNTDDIQVLEIFEKKYHEFPFIHIEGIGKKYLSLGNLSKAKHIYTTLNKKFPRDLAIKEALVLVFEKDNLFTGFNILKELEDIYSLRKVLGYAITRCDSNDCMDMARTIAELENNEYENFKQITK